MRSAAEHVIVDHLGRPILSGYEKRAAMIDLELAGLRRLQHEETRACLERLGVDVSRFSPPYYPREWERPLMVTTRTAVVDSDPGKMRGRAVRYFPSEIKIR